MTVNPVVVEHGVCHPQGPIGKAFRRDLEKDQELKDKYQGLVGHQEKATFRKKWASMKIEQLELQQLQTKSETHSRETATLGTYLPFKKIWDQEGQDEEGFVAFRGTQMGCISKLLHPIIWQ